MQKRRSLSFLLPVCCLLFIFTSCAPAQGPPAPTATRAPLFKGASPIIIRPPLFQVNNVVWSPDGKRIAIANGDGVFQVWEAVTGRLISTHYDRDRSLKISILGWSADGKRIISNSPGPGMTVQVWEADTGNTLTIFSSSYPVAASHDGKYVAVGSGGTVNIWDTSTGKQISTFGTASSHVDQIAWSPDDSLLVTINAQKTAGGLSEDHLAQVWRVTTGTQVCTYQNTSTSYLDHLAWSPDNQRIVSISGTGLGGDAVIAQVWDAASCGPIFRLHGTPGQADDLSWSPDGTHIASWHENQISPMQIWDATTGNLSFMVSEQYPFPHAMAWSPDGKKIVVSGEQLNMQVFDVATGQPQSAYHVDANQNIVTWSPDGQHLASVDLAGTTIWEANAVHRVASIAGRHQIERAVTWSPDGKWVAAEDGARLNAGFWSAANAGDSFGDLQFYHEDISLFNYRNATTVAWSPDGAHVADAWYPRFTYGSARQQVYVWGRYPVMCGLDEDCPVPGGSHSAAISALAWSPDSKRIASASLDKTVLIYDVAHQKNLVIYRGHTDAVLTVAWSPDGKYLASGSADKTIQIWDVTSGTRVLTLPGHTGAVTTVAWSPDSKHVVSSSEDGTVRVWDVIHGNLVLTYRGHMGAVMAAAWSPDGEYIASAGADTTVQVWDANTGKTIYTYHGHHDAVLAVAWSPDGRRVASSGQDGTIQIW